MSTETFTLPVIGHSEALTDLHLDARGLEWTGPDGQDQWMPFACIRLAALARYSDQEWRLRLSGPPGAVIFCSGAQGVASDIAAFVTLARQMIEGAQNAGCGTRYRFQNKPRGPSWFWARIGGKKANGSALIAELPSET